MNKSRMLSTFRTEYRRRMVPYHAEVSALRWVRKFLDEFSIVHSSQIQYWQIEYYIAELKRKGHSFAGCLQAKSSLQFLMKNVLKRENTAESMLLDETPATVKITG